MKPSAEYVRQRLSYDPETGALTWRYHELMGKRWNLQFANQRAGTPCRKGRRQVMLDTKRYSATHLIWLLMTGKWPHPTVDHDDRDPTNDRWSNLREASHDQQAGNKSWRIGKAGFRGVKKNGKRWTAHLGKDYLGSFTSPEAAGAAYDAAAAARWGSFFKPERKSDAFLKQITA